ncbi:hypothetical protein P5G50_05440 [Leifsonia sp. F6_8S_P_1B]|uniref:Lipoprotein n=1 Tax=Leifsonia williamsii TaxID=3035919 RepID=A0ABT8KBN0_9MICO|nr:hypothetical protein [Leifsonia williamsii]MDN4613892.1 hypothetical protein [Leifsonia williamsii]
MTWRGARSRALTAVLAAALLAALTACAGLAGPRSGDDVAHDAARAEADRIAKAIDDSRPRNVLASDFAYRYSDVSGSGGRMDPDTHAELTVDAVSWDGMTRDAGGARFVLSIGAHVQAQSSSFGAESWGEGDWAGCFAFRTYAFFEWRRTSVDGVTCPPVAPSPPPSPAPPPALPDDAAARLTAVLTDATDSSSLADGLEAAFPDDQVRRDEVTGAHLTRDSGAEGTVLGAAVGISGTKDCWVGKRDAAGAVHVWRPEKITLEAGEAGCTLSNALHPVKTH